MSGCALRAAKGSFLNVVFRDFQNSHADFELSGSQYSQGVDKTIVEPRLGEDGKPVLLLQGMKSRSVSSGESFAQWFTDVPGVNIRFDDTLKLQPTGNGRKFRFCSSDFFPLDNREGWPLVARERELGHKFWFTTEVSSTFIYRGNEEFFFSGDDDFWVFIGGQIAIDLGGLHPPASETLRLDEFPYRHEEGTLGLKLGEEYSIDIFHAERHTDKSNFCMETNIDFDGTDSGAKINRRSIVARGVAPRLRRVAGDSCGTARRRAQSRRAC